MKGREKVWINTALVDSRKAVVPVFDRGFLYGDGVFETMRCYAGVVFKLDEHLKRLYTAMRVAGIRPPCPRARLAERVYRTIRANRLTSAYVRVAVTRGEGRFAIGHIERFTPTLVIIAKRFDSYPSRMHERGVSLYLVGTRQNEYSVLSRIKSQNFLNNIIARFEAQDMGCDEALIANTQGQITEAATSNVFIVRRGRIITPALTSGVLPGITRATVIAIARRMGLRVEERALSYREVLACDEAFLTNSLAEVLPVTRVGTRRIGSGSPGTITKLLTISYQKEVIKAVIR